MITVHTIGYEKSSIEDFIATLKLHSVDVLVDIREVPVSRKRGFSKRALSQAVSDAGLEYAHFRALGDPKAGRDAAKRGYKEVFERIFRAHLMGEDAQAALEEVSKLGTNSRICLLCFERDHKCCHRAIVAEELVKRGEALEVSHLGVLRGVVDTGYGEQNESAHSFG
ncbi:MAG: DUF488 domain-containing protein [Rhodospirillales bacterium]|nr:DUF488 domain-containing protein [Rhodospirillales bacterium]